MTNEDLVSLIQQGREDLYAELWERTEKFITYKAKMFLEKLGNRRGVDLEDLTQAGYIALISAVRGYKPAESSFLTYLAYHLKPAFSGAAGIRTERTRQDPLAYAASLEQLISGTNGLSLADIVPADCDELDEIEREIWLIELRAALDTSLSYLPRAEADAIRQRYFQGMELKEAAAVEGVSPERIRQRTVNGLRLLRQRAKKDGLDQFIESKTNYFLHSTKESPVERLVIKREAWRKEWSDRERDQEDR